MDSHIIMTVSTQVALSRHAECRPGWLNSQGTQAFGVNLDLAANKAFLAASVELVELR